MPTWLRSTRTRWPLTIVLENASSTIRWNSLSALPRASVVMSPMYSAAPNGAPAVSSRNTVKSRFGREVPGLDAQDVEADGVGRGAVRDRDAGVGHAARQIGRGRREIQTRDRRAADLRALGGVQAAAVAGRRERRRSGRGGDRCGGKEGEGLAVHEEWPPVCVGLRGPRTPEGGGHFRCVPTRTEVLRRRRGPRTPSRTSGVRPQLPRNRRPPRHERADGRAPAAARPRGGAPGKGRHRRGAVGRVVRTAPTRYRGAGALGFRRHPRVSPVPHGASPMAFRVKRRFPLAPLSCA